MKTVLHCTRDENRSYLSPQTWPSEHRAGVERIQMEMEPTKQRSLGLIAGGGKLPQLVAEGMHEAGVRVVGIGLRDHHDPALAAMCDQFVVHGVLRISSWIKTLRRAGIKEVVIVGRVGKARLMHQPLRWVRQMPDWRAIRVWYRRLGNDRRNNTVMSALADELRHYGLTLIDSTTYVKRHLAHEGVMTRVRTSEQHDADISDGWPMLRRLVSLDIGQSIAICGGRVIAVESLEGTDAMIERAGGLNGAGWTLLKAPAEDHDMRFDVPAIGPTTIERMALARGGCLALNAGRVIMIDKDKVLATAERLGIAIVGIKTTGGS